MAGEPKLNLRQITARVSVDDYAKILQIVDRGVDESGKPMFKDVSQYVRHIVRDSVAGVSLDEEHVLWASAEMERNAKRRERFRVSRRGFLSRIFGK